MVSTEFALLTFSSAASLNLLFSNLPAFPAEPQIIYRIFDVRQINLKFSFDYLHHLFSVAFHQRSLAVYTGFDTQRNYFTSFSNAKLMH